MRQRSGINEKDSVGLYLASVSTDSLLTAQDEIDLARKIEVGLYAEQIFSNTLPSSDLKNHKLEVTPNELKSLINEGREAKHRFVTANLRLVVSLAKRYSHNQLPFLDIIQEGNAGLIRAVEKFDYTKGYKFSTYATWWIRQAITRGIAQQSRLVRIPVHVSEQISQVLSTRRKLSQLHENEITPTEIAAELDLSEETVMDLLRYAQEPVSLDAPIDDDSNASLADLISPNDQEHVCDHLVSEEERDHLNEMLSVLDERSADIVCRRYGLLDGRPIKLTEIAEIWGVSAERVRQLERGALQKLQEKHFALS
jgi:RNA polymerase sigma factor (sigma-70 family)